MSLRIDFVFSYWIFFWYLLYIIKIFKYSPKFALLLGIIENSIMILLMFYYKTSINGILLFMLINFFIKILPYYSLVNERIYLKDIKITALIFLTYCVWIYINGKSIINYQKNIYNSLIYNKDETPLMHFIKFYFKNKKS
jgi:hypothetical protein